MRISNLMLQYSSLANMRSRLASLAVAQEEVTSGRRVRTVSDQPTDAVRIMELEGRLRDIDQFRRNSAAANTRLSSEDAVLDSVHQLLARAKSLTLSGATESPSDPMRIQALSEVQRIREQIVSLGNTQVGDEYILGGSLARRRRSSPTAPTSATATPARPASATSSPSA